MTAEPTLDQDLLQLAAAFDSFNEVSRDLETAYAALEARMGELQSQLSRTDRQHRAQKRRATSLSDRLDSLLETLPGAVVILNAGGFVRQLNTTAAGLLGSRAVGRHWGELAAELFEQNLSEQGDLLARNGTRLNLAERALAHDAGKILLLTDVTEKRQVEEVLARHKRLASLGETVATLAHQIRTPASAALLYASNAKRPGLTADRRCELIEKSIGCLHDLEQLVGDMLRFARGNGGTDSSLFTVRDLIATVRTAVRPLIGADQTVDFHADGNEIALRGNRAALAGAIQNLIVNGLQAAGPGARVAVDAVTCAAGFGEQRLEIRVRDNGPGIEPGLAGKVFEPFYTGRPDGTGLGLPVARSVLRAHRGDVRIEPGSGGGASFLVSLPVSAAAPEACQLREIA